MTRARRLVWIPSFLAGTALAAALATGAGILLYNSRGLTRAGGVLLTVSAVSLVAGILMGSAASSAASDRTVTSAARGWMGFLVALALGAGFVGLWETMNGFGATPVAQGVGLALTSALPAYFAGGVWGRMNGFAVSLGTGEQLQVFAGGAMGLAAGGTLMLALLGEPVLAVTVFLGAAVLASAGARCQGWIFDRVPRRSLTLDTPERPELRFESWLTAIPERSVRVLWDGGTDRAIEPAPTGDWRVGVAGSLDGATGVLFIGAGSWFPVDGDRPWKLFEADGDVRGLAARGFGWEEAKLARSPVPELSGWTVVAEREALSAVRIKSLHEAGVERIWVGGRRGRVPGHLLEDAREVTFAFRRYLGSGPGIDGPPRLAARCDELWCFDRSQAPPEAVDGMTAVSPEVPLGRDEGR
ncbi:MAG: hypothetical protein F4Y07_03255 [Gemmatimonadetes bacterium]|nr:hypothetical protein [Gemmatimonadota bacterium]MYE15478.1 hypothetical protein [Gemmatimonadota bacterium]